MLFALDVGLGESWSLVKQKKRVECPRCKGPEVDVGTIRIYKPRYNRYYRKVECKLCGFVFHIAEKTLPKKRSKGDKRG